jgi:indole-3-glycerol phosphate synthase
MRDFLDVLAQTAKDNIDSDYFDDVPAATCVSASLKQAIIQCNAAAVITEVKSVSPSMGVIRKNFAPEEVAKAMARGGAIGLSVLTEPKHFCGSLRALARIRESIDRPLLMKDIILSPVQLDAAIRAGANAVLLIQALFDRGYCECGVSDMIAEAHERKLEVLLEAHTRQEFNLAAESAADLVGINNRDLRTLKVDLNTTRDILAAGATSGKIVVSESGINSPADVLFLRSCGAKAFLVGSAIMLADDVESKVKELVQAYENTSHHKD